MIDKDITDKIKKWLDTPDHDIAEGAELYLRVTRNRILYDNAIRNPKKSGQRIEYELQKILKRRLIDVTHEQVQELMKTAEVINERYNLDGTKPVKSELQRGKRDDHDALPEEIRNLWEENALLKMKMRECHTHLRLINANNSSCPDNDRFAWVTELIKLDKKVHENYDTYDHFKRERSSREQEDSLKFLRLVNLDKGRFRKSGDHALAKRIAENYAKIINPPEKLKTELAELGIIV